MNNSSVYCDVRPGATKPLPHFRVFMTHATKAVMSLLLSDDIGLDSENQEYSMVQIYLR